MMRILLFFITSRWIEGFRAMGSTSRWPSSQFTSSFSSSQWHRWGQCSKLDDRSGTMSPSMKIHDTMSAILSFEDVDGTDDHGLPPTLVKGCSQNSHNPAAAASTIPTPSGQKIQEEQESLCSAFGCE
uniref:Putative secreted protein n=1 Tax=Anopheles darlingi TaxID=43151 RepID=A0A2M4D7V8_ANODA